MFCYNSLDSPRSIRLLHLQPSTNIDNTPEVHLGNAQLDEFGQGNQSYEALSYFWGVRTGNSPIVCNGAQLHVTPNCHSALRHLRLQKRPRVLWVDAVCINQGETNKAIAERNVQVSLMGEIYSRASRTVCWLGEGTSFTAGVIGHLEKIGQCPSQRGLAKLMAFEGIAS